MAQEIVNRGEIDVDLPDECRIEGDRFQFDDDAAAQLEVIEEQVEEVIAARKRKLHLPADEREAAAQVCRAYHDRVFSSSRRSNRAMLWRQGNCATTRCTISRSGHAAAKALPAV